MREDVMAKILRLSETDASVICHELGHYIVMCLLGKREDIQRIEFEFTPFECNGHVVCNHLVVTPDGEVFIKQWSQKEALLILYAGVAACRITGRSGKRISGTDKAKAFSISEPKERRDAERQAIEMLTPYRNLLNTVTDKIADTIRESAEEVDWISAEMLLQWIPDNAISNVQDYGTHCI